MSGGRVELPTTLSEVRTERRKSARVLRRRVGGLRRLSGLFHFYTEYIHYNPQDDLASESRSSG